VILANQMAALFGRSSGEQLNYLAGQTAVVRLDAAQSRARLSAVHAGRAKLFLLGHSRPPRVAHHRDRIK